MVKLVDKDLTNEFKFVNNLSIPMNYILKRSFEIYKKENINDKEILLFSVDNTNEKQTFFEKNNYKFFIEVTNLTNKEFVNLIKSIIN